MLHKESRSRQTWCGKDVQLPTYLDWGGLLISVDWLLAISILHKTFSCFSRVLIMIRRLERFFLLKPWSTLVIDRFSDRASSQLSFHSTSCLVSKRVKRYKVRQMQKTTFKVAGKYKIDNCIQTWTSTMHNPLFAAERGIYATHEAFGLVCEIFSELEVVSAFEAFAHVIANLCRRWIFRKQIRSVAMLVWYLMTNLCFVCLFQAQFVLCIIHNIRALCTGCAFPPFMSSMLLLNSIIFFTLFMNFYVQNFYKKKSVGTKKVD